MLKPALLYADELQRKHLEQWYKPETNYYSGAVNSSLNLVDNNGETRQFASVDKDNNVIGYIAYNYDWSSRSAYQFGMISYDKGNLEFVKDLYRIAYQILCVDKCHRMEWWCFKDNPAVKGYKKFMKRIGGGIVGELHENCVFPDGTLHDSCWFEIMQKDVNHTAFEKIMKRMRKES